MMFRNRKFNKTLAAATAVGCLTIGGIVVGAGSAANAGTFPGCTAEQLRPEVTQQYAGMSHRGVDVDLVNVSDSTCIVFGGVDGVVRSDHGPAQVQTGGTQFSIPRPSTYTPLEPGKSVRTNLAWDVMAAPAAPHRLAFTINEGQTTVDLPLVETQDVTTYRATNFRAVVVNEPA